MIYLTIRCRFLTYQESTKPIIDYFESIGKLRRVSANGTVDEVFQNIAKLFTEKEPANK
jgi:adenylate kinase family enzyme